MRVQLLYTRVENVEAGKKELDARSVSVFMATRVVLTPPLLLVCLADADPEDYMNFFKRATVFLVMGRMRQAARDLDAVLELKPDFDNVS